MLRSRAAEPQHLRRRLPSIALTSTPSSERDSHDLQAQEHIAFRLVTATLRQLRVHEMPKQLYGDQLSGARPQQFVKDFTASPAWTKSWATGSPTTRSLKSASRRTRKRHGIAYRDEDGQKCYRRRPDVGSARRRAGSAHPRGQQDSAGDPCPTP